jgi:nucleoid DNA-binding protein
MTMDSKPVTVSVKSFLIRRMANDLLIPEKTIEAVVNHQFTMAIEAMKSKKTIEISGFGKFLFNEKRALKRWTKLMSQQKCMKETINDPCTSDVKRRNSELRLNTVLDNIKALKPLLYENS